MPLDHLRLPLPARIEAVQRVEHQISVITSLPIEGHNGIEHDQIAGRRDPAPRIGGAAAGNTLVTKFWCTLQLARCGSHADLKAGVGLAAALARVPASLERDAASAAVH